MSDFDKVVAPKWLRWVDRAVAATLPVKVDAVVTVSEPTDCKSSRTDKSECYALKPSTL
jgi:hypothetical protein